MGLHIVSKEVTKILTREKIEPVFEDLTNIRQSMRSKRRSKNRKALRKNMRRRLNQWPFCKLQSYIEYKTLQRVQDIAAGIFDPLPTPLVGKGNLKHVPGMWRFEQAEWTRVFMQSAWFRERQALCGCL
ncbi:MAG TPA: hypothetical protein EYP46_01000 [Hadesarchaea archaeon]|nr:hypothetical protein [Hadesarchaea archaeon]